MRLENESKSCAISVHLFLPIALGDKENSRPLMIHDRSIHPKPFTDGILLLLIIAYNTLICVVSFFLAPLLLALVAGTAKRRRTFCRRMGWRRFSWQTGQRRSETRRIWVHALSVGEVLAAQPLMTRLMASNSDAELFFTTSTLTGYQTAVRLFKTSYVHLGYFPYDWIGAVRRITRMIDPTHVILTETDIWPTFLWEMKRRGVPVFLVNLRISDHTWKHYKRFKWVVNIVYESFNRVCVQTQTEMDRLAELGVASHRICMTGNLKFDGSALPVDATSVLAWYHRLNIPKEHKVIVAGSTHEGEEANLCDVLKSLQLKNHDVSLVVAPRDPGRSSSLRGLFRQNGLQCEFLSDVKKEKIGHWPQVLIVDAIGELRAIYRIAFAAFVGGSLVPSGGHNPLEPAFWGKPVLFGTDMRDFAVIADYLTTGGGAVRVKDALHLESVLIHLLDQPHAAKVMGDKALRIMEFHQGAVDRTLSFINMLEVQPAIHETKGDLN
jgi:3-deoxy-D-manno-octulosonic-acid transferase